MSLRSLLHRPRAAAAAAVLLLSAALLAALPLMELLRSDGSYSQSLDRLRRTAVRIKAEFDGLVAETRRRAERWSETPWPEAPAERFARLGRLNLNPDIEGAMLADPDGRPEMWLGAAFDLEGLLASGPGAEAERGATAVRVVKSKASVYLVAVRRKSPRGFLAAVRLLAFVPQFKSPYLEEFHFLPAGLRSRCVLDYQDFRDDASGYDRIFERNRDEYVGQPQPQGRVQSLFFPLRDPDRRLAATVTLKTPLPAAVLQSRRDIVRAAAWILLALGLALLGWDIAARPSFRRSPRALAAFLAVLAGFRAAFVLIGSEEMIGRLSVFSPDRAAYRFPLGLARSPADFFLTALTLVLALGAVVSVWTGRPRPDSSAGGAPRFRRAAWLLLPAAAAAYPLFWLAGARWVEHANIHWVNFSLQAPYLLLHLGLLLAWTAAVFLQVLALRTILGLPGAGRRLLPAFLITETALFAVFGRAHPAVFILQAAALGGLLLWMRKPPSGSFRAAALAAVFLAQAVFIYGVLTEATTAKSRVLAGRFLRGNVQSLEPWARFLLSESTLVLDKNARTVEAFFQNPDPARDLARELWDQTPAAKFNWYSSLEILSPEGEILSRFSLNIPKIFRPAAAPAAGAEWTVAPAVVPFMGTRKEFLVAVKDWPGEGRAAGRIVLSLSLDPEMLPFLYSANPYFELLRVNTIPSLQAFDLRFAVFDRDGRIIFNPYKFSTGLPADLIQNPRLGGAGMWVPYADKGRRFEAYVFATDRGVYGVFRPLRGWRGRVAEAIKLALFYALALGAPLAAAAYLSARRKKRPFLWSFADRVYLSFLLVALIPLVLFPFFSRSFFSRVFTQQFEEKAEIHADMARRVMDDLFLRQGEGLPVLSSPEDLGLWIGTTIDNDVNLYRDGRLISSSRREFSDAGLLPEFLDGEVYYRLRYENNPYAAKARRIGRFALRTLTISYADYGQRLFISLPFPFERQEIRNASAEMAEFLYFVSVFFIGVVLLLARGIGTMIVDPIRRLLLGTREASLGNLEIAIEYGGGDEMRTLVDGFNTMIRSLKAHQQELADLGKRAAWAEMARKVAHEIKNPLTPIQLSAEHILRVFEDGRGDFEKALRESLSYIISEVENLRRIAGEFLDISREPLARRDEFRLDDLVRETVEPYRSLLAERILFRLEFQGQAFKFSGDRSKLKTALRNLMTNAIESIRGQGEIRIAAEARDDELLVTVADTGAGMDKDVLDRVFEPYYSTKDVGTGLGLPITKKIIEDHGGSIRVSSEPGRGTTVVLRLPRPAA